MFLFFQKEIINLRSMRRKGVLCASRCKILDNISKKDVPVRHILFEYEGIESLFCQCGVTTSSISTEVFQFGFHIH